MSLKHLLSDEMSEIQDFLNSLANKQLREVIKSYRSNYKCFPVVLKGRYTINDVQDLMYEIPYGYYGNDLNDLLNQL